MTAMTDKHIVTKELGTCLLMCARTHTHTHIHARTHFDMVTRTPPLQGLVVVGGCRSFCDMNFTRGGGGLENHLGGFPSLLHRSPRMH